MAQFTATKFAHLKKKNKRINIWYGTNEAGEFVMIQKTKKLISFKDRHIVETDFVIGMETFMALHSLYELIQNSPEFNKEFNREIGQVCKDKFSCQTNIIAHK